MGAQVLGLLLLAYPGNTMRKAVATQAIERLKQRLRDITRRTRGCSLIEVVKELRGYIPGWKAYFRLAQPCSVHRHLDSWLRHRLRAIQLKQWKTARTAYREMRRLGAPHEQAAGVAAHAGRWWRGSQNAMNSIFTIAYFDRLGVPRFS